ncbi:MAG: quinol:cytochrome C oxidoreductase [Acidobacteria bacterium]|nr:quinol:cytochrome C oxidoreductase [Acidobacteriota bacterium]
MISEGDHAALAPEQATIPPGHSWHRIPIVAGVIALVGAVACAILGAANPKQFFFSWLVSFLFFLSLALGALFFVLIQYAAQGGWGIVLRRIGETTFATIPVMAVLFLPVLLGLHDLYEWSHAEAVAADALLRWKAPYLNVPFFLIRAVLYFGIWSFIALIYYRGSRGQDVTGDLGVSARLRRFAGPAIIVLALTQTFASVDWIMSLTPHWYSTMFGVYFFAGSFVGFIALLSVIAPAMRQAGLLDAVISPEHLQDVGKLLFAFTVFWTYIAFSQFFLIWYGNLPEETIWYKARMEGSWMTVSLFLMAGHFVAPFFYLMGRAVKRNNATLAAGGVWLLIMHFLDLYWQVMPTLHPEGLRPSLLDIAALLAVGGCFVAAASWLMRRQALVPLRDPRLAESLAFENV